MLLLIAGLPATGKTTLAEALAREIGAQHYHSDKVRGALDLMGQYDKPAKDRVYLALLEAAEAALSRGKPVIVDATFSREHWRDRFENLGRMHQSPVFWVLLEASPESIYSRMQLKRKYSEADFVVYQLLRERFEPFARPHLTMFSDARHLKDLVNRTVQYIKEPHWDESLNNDRL
ncbi:MAG: AAA family ATPase [Lewinella sp.]|nr:AAA family ATPase [Lewinella sp.]